MLLVVTNSQDGSADSLGAVLASAGTDWFRLNTDLFGEYRMAVGPPAFEVEDPSGRRVTSATLSAAYWRKPFLNGDGTAQLPVAERGWVLAHWQRMTRDLIQWCQSEGKLRLVDPEGDRRLGKVAQMRMAADLFFVPPWSVTSGLPPHTSNHVVKTLVPEMIEGERLGFVYTAPIPSGASLDPRYPWFVQEARPGGRDATVVYIAGKCFGFEVDQSREETGVDWRVHINTATPLS